jgi:hypothetical protein
MSEDDLKLVSASFMEKQLPREQQYLLKYFPWAFSKNNEIQRQFLFYYLEFGHTRRFREHTGCYCSERWLKKLTRRFKKLTEAHAKAKQEMDLETLTLIEMGKFKDIK